MKKKYGAILLATTMVIAGAQAESITHGTTTINMDFVNIEYAGNVPDSSGFGSVDYNYRIGKYEVTRSQWNAAAFSVMPQFPLGQGGDIQAPVSIASWYESARFANWLTTGNPYAGAYQFSNNSVDSYVTSVDRAMAVSTYGKVYVLPTEDEWYKAAYFQSDGGGYTLYATGDTLPAMGGGGENYGHSMSGFWNVGSGIAENNGTFDMNGNIREWTESALDGTLDDISESRAYRGGAWNANEENMRSTYRAGVEPQWGGSYGIRIVVIPEPSSVAMIGLVSGCAVFIRRTFMI